VKINFLLFLLYLFIALPAQAADNGKPLKGKELENAQAMNNIYARHILTSSCINRQVGFFMPSGISSEEKSLRMNAFKKNCDCAADIVMKNYSPNDVIDYVTDEVGGKKSQSKSDAAQNQKFKKMFHLMNVDKKTRKTCGFQN